MNLDNRLERLERANRRQRFIIVAIVIALGIQMGCGDSQPTGKKLTQVRAGENLESNKIVESLRVKQIEIVNEHGIGIIRLGAISDGGAIEIKNSDGKPQIVLGAFALGKATSAGILLKSRPADTVAVHIFDNDAGGGTIDVYNSLENIAAEMTSLKTNSGAVTAHNAKGTPTRFLMDSK